MTGVFQHPVKPLRLKRSFLIEKTRSGPLIFQRVGRGKGSYIVPVYALEKQVPIIRRIRLVDTAQEVIDRITPQVMNEMLAKAIARSMNR